MSKKDRKKQASSSTAPLPETQSPPILSKRGWKIVGAGILVVIAGFITLTFTDPRGQNLASDVSPFLIIGGYAIIGAGILAKDRA